MSGTAGQRFREPPREDRKNFSQPKRTHWCAHCTRIWCVRTIKVKMQEKQRKKKTDENQQEQQQRLQQK
jgi:hypothetical protein